MSNPDDEETERTKELRAEAERAVAEELAKHPLTDAERAAMETGERDRERMIAAAPADQAYQARRAVLHARIEGMSDEELQRAEVILGVAEFFGGTVSREDPVSPLQSMADALFDADMMLEDSANETPPSLSLPSASTSAAFIEALLAHDEDRARKAVQMHCDTAFYSVLRQIERHEPPLKPGESAHDRGMKAGDRARSSVVVGALFYARFFGAVAQTLRQSTVNVSENIGEDEQRARA